MKTPEIILRPAHQGDTPLIAQAVAIAIGSEEALFDYCGDDYLNVLRAIASADATQYSWRFALVAECDGRAVGAVVGYDGARLKELREGTFAIVRDMVGRVPDIADETEAGEYYLDSLCVLPQHRKMGIATRLIKTLYDKIFAEGHTRLGLIVDFNNPSAEQLYTQIGFKRVGQRIFLGHKMWHLVLEQCIIHNS